MKKALVLEETQFESKSLLTRLRLFFSFIMISSLTMHGLVPASESESVSSLASIAGW